MHCLEIRASIESTIANALDRTGNVYFCQRTATLEGAFSDRSNRSTERNISDSGASIKEIMLDIDETIPNDNGLQRSTVIESGIFSIGIGFSSLNTLYAVRENNTLNLCVCESFVGNLRHRHSPNMRRNHHIRPRSSISRNGDGIPVLGIVEITCGIGHRIVAPNSRHRNRSGQTEVRNGYLIISGSLYARRG